MRSQPLQAVKSPTRLDNRQRRIRDPRPAAARHLPVPGRPFHPVQDAVPPRLEVVETRTILGTTRYGSVQNLIETEVKGTPLADRLSDDQISQILAESTGIFAKFLTPAAQLQMPIRGAPRHGPQTLGNTRLP